MRPLADPPSKVVGNVTLILDETDLRAGEFRARYVAKNGKRSTADTFLPGRSSNREKFFKLVRKIAPDADDLDVDQAIQDLMNEVRRRLNEEAAKGPQRPAGADPPEQTTPRAEAKPRTLGQMVKTFEKWLYRPDPGQTYVTLGAVAANYMQGDPLWLMLVGASSGGKTEEINAIGGLPDVHRAATLTEAALLSATPRKDIAHGAKGGLLREIGDFGILALKDFTSVLSMNRDARAALLAALREIYDGNWTRHVGTDGGRTLSWSGKLGLVAGCTTIIDSHHAVISVMGERFLLYRLPEIDPKQQARQALKIAGREQQMRAELAEAVAGLFAGLDLPKQLPPLDADESDRLEALASLAARARSPVERDARTGEITLIPDPEAPARIVQALRRLYSGMLAVAVDKGDARKLIVKVGLDCMPKIRRSVFEYLVREVDWRDTTAIATASRHPTATARRALEELTVHGLAERRSGGKGKPDLWRLTDWARGMYGAATLPEMSVKEYAHGNGGGQLSRSKEREYASTDFSGKPPPAGVTTPSRTANCWRCASDLSDDDDAQCDYCGWMICPCGACGRECDASAEWGNPESPRRKKLELQRQPILRIAAVLGQARGGWLTRTAIDVALQGAVAPEEIGRALEWLKSRGWAERRSVQTSGRLREEWRGRAREDRRTA